MPKEFNPNGTKISMDIGKKRRLWIHERAIKAELTDTQYLCKLIDLFKEELEKNV